MTDIGEMRGIETRPDGHRIGGRVTWSDIVRADLPDYFDGLRLAAREVGGVQIQNRGTVAGNICNASPAADGVPPLLSLDAIVDIAGADGTRQLPLAQFIEGNRRTALKSGELVTGLFIPKRDSSSRATFLKLGARRYLVISIAMVAVTLDLDDAETIQDARVAVGACSEVACRLPGVEDALKGKSMTADLAGELTSEMFEALAHRRHPRADAVYRRTLRNHRPARTRWPEDRNMNDVSSNNELKVNFRLNGMPHSYSGDPFNAWRMFCGGLRPHRHQDRLRCGRLRCLYRPD